MTNARKLAQTAVALLVAAVCSVETAKAEWGWCSGLGENKLYVSQVFEVQDWFEAKSDLEFEFHTAVRGEYGEFLMVSLTECPAYGDKREAEDAMDEKKAFVKKDGLAVVRTDFEWTDEEN